jgi:hypothetical protein
VIPVDFHCLIRDSNGRKKNALPGSASGQSPAGMPIRHGIGIVQRSFVVALIPVYPAKRRSGSFRLPTLSLPGMPG